MKVEQTEKLYRVLFVDDDEDDYLLTTSALGGDATGGRFDFDWEVDWKNVPAKLADGTYDACLLDYRLGEKSGLEILRGLIEAGCRVPVILLTGQGDRALDLEAMDAGAADYLVKGRATADQIERSIRYAIEHQRLRNELRDRAREQIAMKNEFLSHVSHELRSPLNSIYQFVSIVKDGLAGKTTKQQREFLRIAEGNVGQLRSMIEDLLDATRSEAGTLRVDRRIMQLDRAVWQAIAALGPDAVAAGIDLQVDMPERVPFAFADPERVHQVITNLVQNAIKFTPEGGRIIVRIVINEDDWFEVSVRDTGTGIRREHLAEIFERMYQGENTVGLSRKGLGLGLYICKQIVELGGGEIGVDSEPGVGSTFTFTVPRYSLARIIRPVVLDEGRVRPAVSLIEIELDEDGSVSQTVRHDVRYGLEKIMHGSVIPNQDLVLPRGEGAYDESPCRLLVSADEDGSRAIASRLGAKLGVLTDGTGMRARVTITPIEVPARTDGSAEDIVKQVAWNVEKAIQE